MNLISTLRLHFQMQNESFAQSLYARWDSFFTTCVERVADEVLSKYDKANEQIEIDKLELDLGTISEEELDIQFPLRFREKLEEAIVQCLYNTTTNKQEVSQISKKENSFQLLCNFLLHGTLSWAASGDNRDIHKLFLKVLQDNAKEFKQFLQVYGHYTSLQERLVYQLNNPELEKGVRLLTPDSGDFIISYVRLLCAKHKGTQQPETTESNFRNTVWLVVYAYLLTQRSSYFDKKSFITQTITQLAGRYNLSYDNLLTSLTCELASFRKKCSIPLELFQILISLQKELSEKRLNETSIDAAKFYRIVYTSLKKELDGRISEDSHKGLIHILSNPSSCRQFLQQLSEPEIIRLVPVVAQQESKFVIEVAQSLEQQKEQGALQGKTGGEFCLLKWQIIFPLLLEKRDSQFNRKLFVYTVLKQIAAHYNLEIYLMLEYFTKDSEILLQMDMELKVILSELIEELAAEYPEKKKEKATTVKDKLHQLLYALTSHETLTLLPVKQIWELLSDNSFRNNFLNLTREAERYQLVKVIYPKEQEFIIAYIKSLDKLSEHTALQTKMGNNFPDMKWVFFFTVLSQMPDDSFNRRHFVSRVLKQTAAHYNLNYFDLLLYFREEKMSIHLPFDLDLLLTELYQVEQKKWYELIIKNSNETDKYQYLTCFCGVELRFVKTYLQVLDSYHNKGSLQGKVSGNFKELKWHFVFSILLESQHIAFNKKHFVLRTLKRMAAHYHLSLYEVLNWLNSGFTKTNDSKFKDIGSIIYELHKEYQSSKKTSIYLSEENEKKIKTDESEKSFSIHSREERKLFEQLIQQTDFLIYTESCLKIFFELKKYIRKEFNKIIDNRHFLEFLIQQSVNYRLLNRIEIFNRIMEYIIGFLNPLVGQKIKWEKKLEELAKGNYLLVEYIQKMQEMEKKEKTQEVLHAIEARESEVSYIHNAGLVLLAPFLSRLFNMLELIENNKLKDCESRIRAIYLLQYIVFEKTDFPEYEMTINKLLTGYETGESIPRNMELTEKELDTVNSLLKAVLQHWDKLKNTSISGLREGFLQRDGKLEEKEDHYILTVEEKAYDMLLDSVPWNFRMIKFPWMEKRIEVRWR